MMAPAAATALATTTTTTASVTRLPPISPLLLLQPASRRRRPLRPTAAGAAATSSAAAGVLDHDHHHHQQQQQQQQQQHRRRRRQSTARLTTTRRQQQQQHHRRLPCEQLLDYERHGHVTVRSLLDAQQLLGDVAPALQRAVAASRLDSLRHRVRVLAPGVDAGSIATEAQARAAIADAGEELGFLQFFNLHRTEPAVAALVARGGALAGAAAQLLGCGGGGTRLVRLYQTAVFLKEPGFSETNWHSDCRIAPLDTNAFVTAWVPLRDIIGGDAIIGGGGSNHHGSSTAAERGEQTAAAGAAAAAEEEEEEEEGSGAVDSSDGPVYDSGLVFARGSHRDVAACFWRDITRLDLSSRGYQLASCAPMRVGDVSFHHGWTVHGAPAQPPGTPPRLALAACFFADGAHILPASSSGSSGGGSSSSKGGVRAGLLHDEDAESYAGWLGELRRARRRVARHALLPLVWPPEARGGAGGSGGGDGGAGGAQQ